MKIKILNVVDVEKVKNYMKENDLTKSQFAERCRISVPTLNRVLGKWTCFKLNTVFKVARGMNIQPYQVFKDEKPQIVKQN